MHRITISVLSMFFILPSFASARLPVVNVASGGVSAREMFGEVDVKSPAQTVARTESTRTKKVVARSAKKTPSVNVDSGEHIVMANDVLIPSRPSADLWAKNDVSLRMPNPNEFSVYRTDSQLPEERIDQTYSVAKTVAPAVKTQVVSAMPEIDSQIARLVDLQKRAEESVRTVSPRVIAAPIAQNNTESVSVASIKEENPERVSLRRMVVDMDDTDVVVRKVEKNLSPRIAGVRDDMTKMTPNELRNAFRKTFLSENKHLSTYSIDDSFDVVSDMSSAVEGFTAKRDLSETDGGIRPLEIKIKFRDDDAALSRANYNLLTEYAGIVVNKPTRAIQIAIPEYMTNSTDNRKLAARRLAIVEQVLTDNGVSKQRIVPVLSGRQESGFVLRIISGEQYDTLTQQQYNMFGDNTGKKIYKSMTW